MEYPVTPEPPQACAAVILGFRVSGQVGRVERAEIQQHCVELEGGGAETGRGLRAGGKGPRGYANIMIVISSLNSRGRHTNVHCVQSRVFGLIKLIETSVRCYPLIRLYFIEKL